MKWLSSVLAQVAIAMSAMVMEVVAFATMQYELAALIPSLTTAGAAASTAVGTSVVVAGQTVTLGVTGTAIAGTAAGIISSLVSQSVAIAVREQHGIRLKDLLLSGAEGGLSAGTMAEVNGVNSGLQGAAAAFEKNLIAALGYGMNNAMDQLGEMMMNNTKSFNFGMVAASMINGLSNTKVQNYLSGATDNGLGGQLVGIGLTSTENFLIADALSRTTVNPAQLAATAIGSVVAAQASSALNSRTGQVTNNSQSSGSASQSTSNNSASSGSSTSQGSTAGNQSSAQAASIRAQVERTLQVVESAQDTINAQPPQIGINGNDPSVVSSLGGGLAQLNAQQQAQAQARPTAAAGSSVTSGMSANSVSASANGSASNVASKASAWNNSSSSSSSSSTFWNKASSVAAHAGSYISNAFWSGIDDVNRAGNAIVNADINLGNSMINNANQVWNGNNVGSRVSGAVGLATNLATIGSVAAGMGEFAGVASQVGRFGVSSLLNRLGTFGNTSVSEISITNNSTVEILSPEEQVLHAMQQSRISEQLENIPASSVNAAVALANKYSALQKIQEMADGIEVMPDNSVRYYGVFRSANTPGPTTGARLVTSYDPNTLDVSIWNENYDLTGNVNRISLKNINGVQVNALHFPPTLQDNLNVANRLRPSF